MFLTQLVEILSPAIPNASSVTVNAVVPAATVRGSELLRLGFRLVGDPRLRGRSGGELHVTNRPGHGCVVTIDLPQRPKPS